MSMERTAPPPASTHWFGLWVLAAAAAWGAVYFWPIGQQGDDLACLAGFCLGLVAVAKFFAGLKAWDLAAAYRIVRKRSRVLRQDHGEARFAGWGDLKGSKMNSSKGLFLGRLERKELYIDTDCSALAIAGPGQGKTTSLAIPNLLSNPASMVVVDTKGSLFATTARARRAMGQRVWCLSPCFEEMNAQVGQALFHDDGFDPAAHIRADHPGVIDQCEQLARLLIPSGANASENDEYWRTFAQEIIVAFCLLQLVLEDRVSLPGLRRLVMSDDAEMPELIQQMADSDAFSGTLAENGKRLAQVVVNSPKLWSSGLSGACKSLRAYDRHGYLGKHVSKSGVDFRDFRSQPTTCYIQLPSDRMSGVYAAWLGSVLSLSMDQIARDGRKRHQVCYILDEFQNLPRLEVAQKGLALYREFGIQYLFLVQFAAALASQRLYGHDWREFLGCEVVSIFGASSDVETLKLVSDLAGQESFRNPGASLNPEQAMNQALGMSFNATEQGRALIRPEAARTLPAGKQIIFAESHQPIIADKVPYYTAPKWRRAADPNPYL